VASAGGDLHVHAPKDDPLHLARWRKAYPADEALAHERLALWSRLDLCRERTWLHPLHVFGRSGAEAATSSGSRTR
jgi:beta-N-acetylglucosaminidase